MSEVGLMPMILKNSYNLVVKKQLTFLLMKNILKRRYTNSPQVLIDYYSLGIQVRNKIK